MAQGVPIIGLWHSGGARLAEGVASLHAVGSVFAAMTLCLGYGPADLGGPRPGGRAVMGRPSPTSLSCPRRAGSSATALDVVRSVTGEDVDMARLGGHEPHSRRSGVAAIVTDSDTDAIAQARHLAALLGDQGKVADDTPDAGFAGLLPESPRRAYDVHPVIGQLLDEPGVEAFPEVGAERGDHARPGGGTVGVIANNPLRLGGCLDATSAESGPLRADV